MTSPRSSDRRVRAGLFEIDLGSGEVHKSGLKVPLQEQPFRLLAMLLERPGQVITREEVRAGLWPTDTFVGFDESINTAIRKLRVAFGDSADNPRFIETVSRGGYRFIAPVEPAQIPPASPGKVAEATPRYSSKHRFRLVVLAASAVLITAAALVGLNVAGRRDRIFARKSELHIQSLAVLPLANLSGDSQQEYFADAMTEALISELGKVDKLRVISRQSVMQYRASDKSLQKIARELNVDAVLEGTVERSGNRVRVTVRLDQVAPEGQLWAKQYNRDLHDLLRLQDEIAQSVTDEIQVRLTPQERARLATSRVVDAEAQDDYLRALHFHHRSSEKSEQDLLTAIGYFKQAIEKDPNYGLAYAGMAYTYIDLGNPQGGNHPPTETLPLARAAATRAVDADPLLGEAHFVLAQTLEYDWNWSEAEHQYQLALELSPNYAPAHVEYGRLLQALGQNKEAMKQMAYAVELNPIDLETRDIVGYVTYAARQYDSAIAYFAELNASYPGERDDFGLGWSYRGKKMYPEAIAALRRDLVRSQRRPISVASLASVYGLAGKKREALKLIAELKEKSEQHHISASVLAEAYSGLGEKEEAISWLERAYDEHDQGMVYIKAYPGWDALRSEPRFQALVSRMNFPP
jgi:TolB-like protein/DNA-binding winged helix-turn-helix (wHTH) protein/Flp pilus assembly protein TadD